MEMKTVNVNSDGKIFDPFIGCKTKADFTRRILPTSITRVAIDDPHQRVQIICVQAQPDTWFLLYEPYDTDKEFCPCCGQYVDHYNAFDGYLCKGYKVITSEQVVKKMILYKKNYPQETIHVTRSDLANEHLFNMTLEAYVKNYIHEVPFGQKVSPIKTED